MNRGLLEQTPRIPGTAAITMAIGAVFAVYFYFLIFAEFAFLRLAAAGLALPEAPPGVLVALGLGGIAGSLWAGRERPASGLPVRLGAGLAACALSGAGSIAIPSPTTVALATAIGFSLGWTAVTLCCGLISLVGLRRLGVTIGTGTGLAYGACNLPAVFEASPGWQAGLAATAAGLASLVAFFGLRAQSDVPIQPTGSKTTGGGEWIALLGTLVCLDSAAFYLIQKSEGVRSATWAGTGTLLANAAVHAGGAFVAGLALSAGRRIATVFVSALLLLGACAVLTVEKGAEMAGVQMAYVAGVSGYSVALVYVGAVSGRPAWVGRLFSIAGWAGSAVGIGAVHDRANLPAGFVIAAAAVAMAALWRLSRKPLRSLVLAAGTVGLFSASSTELSAAAEAATLGREIYIREGCIHCHSQFVRPETSDVERWGPRRSLAAMLAGAPPLPGNRRQGPDLTNVGNRRTPEWNRLHLIEPSAIAKGSRMPSYRHLFAEKIRPDLTAGDALVVYLATLGLESFDERQREIAAWRPGSARPAEPARAERLYGIFCAGCHGSGARGDGPLATTLSVRPPDFGADPWRRTKGSLEEVARIVKFGLAGSPMAGHEYLEDAEVLSLVRYVISLHRTNVSSVNPVPAP